MTDSRESDLGAQTEVTTVSALEVEQGNLAMAYIRVGQHFWHVQKQAHMASVRRGWWNDTHTGESLIGKRNVPELLCLIHSEISEAMEGYRKDLMDSHLPNRKSIEVELADAVIRIADLGEALGLDIGEALAEKMAYNDRREDHDIKSRQAANGKKF